MSTISKTTESPYASIEAAVQLYLEQQHNFDLWQAGEDVEDAMKELVSE